MNVGIAPLENGFTGQAGASYALFGGKMSGTSFGLMRRGLRLGGMSLGAASVALLLAPPVSADDVMNQCIEQHENTQLQRSNQNLILAREAALLCSNAGCPELIQSDCNKWFSELKAAVPSVILRVRKGEKDIVAAEITIDGKPLAAQELGRELELDPGTHEVRVHHDGQEQHQSVVLVAGEKSRRIDFVFEEPLAEPAPIQKAQEPMPPRAPAVQSRPQISPLTWGLAGGAVAATAVGTGFLISAHLKYKELSESCAPHCRVEDTRSVKTRLVVADVSFGVALAATVGAIVSYAWDPREATERAGNRLSFEPRERGASLGWTVQF